MTLNVPRLKGLSFEAAIIERCRRREISVEEALIEMYLAGVCVRRVEDISEALQGSKVSAATISDLNKKAYVHIKAQSIRNSFKSINSPLEIPNIIPPKFWRNLLLVKAV